MIEIKCPWCGPRNHTEFTYMGDATLTRPADGPEASEEDWFRFVYIRQNPKGPHDEYWHHTNGCRQMVKVRRNVVTHEVLATGRPGEDLRGEEEGAGA